MSSESLTLLATIDSLIYFGKDGHFGPFLAYEVFKQFREMPVKKNYIILLIYKFKGLQNFKFSPRTRASALENGILVQIVTIKHPFSIVIP